MAFGKASNAHAAVTTVVNQLKGRESNSVIDSTVGMVERIANNITRNQPSFLKPRLGMPRIMQIKRERADF